MFLPFLKGLPCGCPSLHANVARAREREEEVGLVRVREGKSISTSTQSFRASPSLEPFHCRLGFCAFAFSHHPLSVCRYPAMQQHKAALSIITVHEHSLRIDVKTQVFLPCRCAVMNLAASPAGKRLCGAV